MTRRQRNLVLALSGVIVSAGPVALPFVNLGPPRLTEDRAGRYVAVGTPQVAVFAVIGPPDTGPLRLAGHVEDGGPATWAVWHGWGATYGVIFDTGGRVVRVDRLPLSNEHPDDWRVVVSRSAALRFWLIPTGFR